MAMSTPFDNANAPYALVILYGPLSGLEFPLSAGRHFFVTSRETLEPHDPFDATALVQTPNSYVVPGSFDAELGVPNFAIAFDPSPMVDTPFRAIVEIYSDCHSTAPARATEAAGHTFELSEGDLFDYAGLRFAWKRVGRPWPTTWRRPLFDASASDTMSEAREPTIDPDREPFAAPGANASVAQAGMSGAFVDDVAHADYGRRRPARWPAYLFALCSLGAGAAALANYAHVDDARLAADSIESALQSGARHGAIRHGNDGLWYVLVSSRRDATWAAQALRPVEGTTSVQIRIESDEAQRVESMLARRSVPFYGVRFDSAKQLRLVLIGNPAATPPSTDEALKQAALTWVPYADEVHIERHLESTVTDRARDGLDALNLRYRQSQRGDIVTFELDALMDDARLSQFGEFADRFARDWGRQKVRFILDTPSDPVRAQAYRVRARGYVSTGRDAVEFTLPVS